MFTCLYVPDFPTQAAWRCEPSRQSLAQSAVVVVDGPSSLLRVISVNTKGRHAGIVIGMTKLQAESCGPVITKKRKMQNEDSAQSALLDCARSFSPRVESTAPGTVILDLEGTERLFGSPQNAATQITEKSREFGFDLNIAVATNPDTSLCAARGWNGITVISAGEESRRLAPLPIYVLAPSPEIIDTLNAWGIRNFGSLAQLPPISLVERLGQPGLQLQRLARGESVRTLAVVEPATDFVESFEFDDPVETLESLTFILNRLVLQLCARLTSRALAMDELRLCLELETRQRLTEAKNELFERVWKLPLPMADAKVLVRLTSLDLDSCVFAAPIKKITLEAVPAKPRSSQGGLFAPVSPQAEQLEITLARIRSVVGSIDESGIASVGSPRVRDSHRPDSFTVERFSSIVASENTNPVTTRIVLRMFRPSVETVVELRDARPHSIVLGKRTLRVLASSGPWTTSGKWWKRIAAWAREEWDVALKTSEGVGFYRIYSDGIRRKWFVEGMFD